MTPKSAVYIPAIWPGAFRKDKGDETDHLGNPRERWFMNMGERYAMDFSEAARTDAWYQFDMSQDAWYYGTWVNPESLQILSFTEGDIYLTNCKSPELYEAELRHMAEWDAERIGKTIEEWGKGVDDHDGKYQQRLEASKANRNHWDDLDDETFNSILLDIAGKMGVAGILGTPGVLEILREELNNEVLEEWAERNNRDPDTGAPLEDEA